MGLDILSLRRALLICVLEEQLFEYPASTLVVIRISEE